MISVVINTKNAAPTLARAISSVASFADEVLIVDMCSTDDTRAVAEKLGAHVVPFLHDSDFVEPARNFAIEHAKGDWILVLDADEEISESLGNKLKTLSQKKNDIAAYELPRKNILFDQWIQHTGWWPDYLLRFFRKGTVRWGTEIHQPPTVQGKVEKLAAEEQNAIIHHNYQTIEQFIERMNRYTSIEAHQRTQLKTIRPSNMLAAFADEFCRRFFVEQGSKDGLHGLSLSTLQSYYEFVVLLKVWQNNKFVEPSKNEFDSIQAVESLRKTLSYWLADWQAQHSQGPTKWWWQLRRKLQF